MLGNESNDGMERGWRGRLVQETAQGADELQTGPFVGVVHG